MRLAVGFGIVACVLTAGCSAEGDAASGGRRDGTGSSTTTGGSGGGSSGASGSDFGNADTRTPTPTPTTPTGTGTGTTEVAFSYIWIANSAQGTVSKIDTETMQELGRYQTRPDGLGRPSRTSVAHDGDVAVANRDGGITKFYANVEDCVDRNGNGTIETSTGANDVLPWDAEECRAWHTPLTYFSNRPIAWAPAPSPDVPAKVWTAAAVPPGGAPCGPLACSIDVLRLAGDTGVVEDMFTISGMTGTDFITGGLAGGFPVPFAGAVIENYGPYGGASDAGGNFWIFVSNTAQLVRVDAVTLDYRVWAVEPVGNGYGITIDAMGRIFICGALGLSRFDPTTETWMSFRGTPVLGMNGCMSDGAGTIWVGGGSDQGDPGLHAFDADTLTHIASHPVGTVKGVSIDVNGYVWGVGSQGFGGLGAGNGSTAWRLDPVTGQVDMYAGLTGAYSYSDMTGFGLTQAGVLIPPQ